DIFKSGDRTHTHRIQIAAGFRRVTLKVPMQGALVLCAAYLIFGPREVIEPNVAITGAGQLADGVGEDAELLKALGKKSRKTALLFFHPWNVSVAEQGDAVRTHRDD